MTKTTDLLKEIFIYDSVLFTVIFIITIINIIISIKISKNNKKKTDNTSNTNNIDNKININEAKDLMSFFDNLLKTKFNYYLINEILPQYSAGKKLDKSQIKELQKEYFLDISALINKKFKKSFLKYYTAPGLELYINEQFIYFLNKFDSLQSLDDNALDSKSIHNIIK